MSEHPSESGPLTVEVPLTAPTSTPSATSTSPSYHQCLAEVRVPILSRSGAYRFVLRRVELDHLSEVMIDDGPLQVSAEVSAVGDSSVTSSTKSTC